MRIFGVLTVLLLGLSGPLLAAPASSANKQQSGKAKAAGDQEKSPQQKAMDTLAQAGIQQAIKAIEKSGSFYPFGLIQHGDIVQAVGYSGKPKDAPKPEDWARSLFVELGKVAKKRPDIDLMAMFRLHDVKGKDGKTVKGIWAEVDHRKVRPWIIFLPLVKHEDTGKYSLGKMIYYPTKQGLFEQHQKK
ncbi:MAG: hypothetical protein R3292_07280 [Alcanivorax sp.]|nr:hypothetical protein [Alcanivorax sp.]